MNKQQTIFRQKSVDRVSSPEQLDSYLKVTSPSVWLVLVGIIFILVGFIAWGAFGKLKTYSPVGCSIENNNAYCYIKEDEGLNVNVGMTVEIPNENVEFIIQNFENNGINIPNTNKYLQHIVDVTSSDYVFLLTGTCKLPNGYYAGRVITESISPLKFIFN